MTDLTEVSGIGPAMAEDMRARGLHRAQDVAEARPEDLAALPRIGLVRAERLIESAKAALAAAAVMLGEVDEDAPSIEASELEQRARKSEKKAKYKKKARKALKKAAKVTEKAEKSVSKAEKTAARAVKAQKEAEKTAKKLGKKLSAREKELEEAQGKLKKAKKKKK